EAGYRLLLDRALQGKQGSRFLGIRFSAEMNGQRSDWRILKNTSLPSTIREHPPADYEGTQPSGRQGVGEGAGFSCAVMLTIAVDCRGLTIDALRGRGDVLPSRSRRTCRIDREPVTMLVVTVRRSRPSRRQGP